MPTAIEFFKLLPKTNCKDCGQPTCLAFAMQLANQKAALEDCPHVDQGAKDSLAESSAPPVRTVTIGTGERSLPMGGETVLYRHERRFVNPVAYAVTVSDLWDAPRLQKAVADAASLSFQRVGMVFRLDAVRLRCDSADGDRFTQAATELAALWDGALVLESKAVEPLEQAARAIKSRKPLLQSANPENVKAMGALSKETGCPLAVQGSDLQGLADLVEQARATGAEDLVLDPMASSIHDIMERNTALRRSALKRKFKVFGYPILNDLSGMGSTLSAATVATLRYSSLVIFDQLKVEEALPLFTLRQNIYTDPQVPIQVKQALYPVNDPDQHSPIFFTTNFSLTYFTVRADIEKSKMPVWLQVVDTEGLSVLTAYAAGKFTPENVTAAFQESGVLDKSDGPVVVPGLVARMSGKLELAIGRKVVVGTNESTAIPRFLKRLAESRGQD